MSEPQYAEGSPSRKEERNSTPDVLIPESHERFMESLYEFIEHEKRYLRFTEEEPDELRYLTYRSAFNKVIARSTTYKRLLLTIKAEYDDVIRVTKAREAEFGLVQKNRDASSSKLKSLMSCNSQIANLRERICDLQREAAELQQETRRLKLCKEQTVWIPGATLAQSEDLDLLDKHLEHLEAVKAALLDQRRRCVSVDINTKLVTQLQAVQLQQHQLNSETSRRRLLYRRLRCVCDALSRWEGGGQQVPLEELLGSTLENIRQTRVTDEDICSIDAEVFESEEPTETDGSKLLPDYLDRFVGLFESAQYEEAALLAAHSPGGVLRNVHTMDMFKGMRGSPGSIPPFLLYFQALLMTLPAGEALSASVSLQGVHCALEQSASQLVTHAITQNKLTFSEDLGDILTEHAQKKHTEADMFLALSTIVYEACGLRTKTALSMCRRGLIHSAAEFMSNCEGFTTEDCMWVICRSPSLSLLQLLAGPHRGRAPIMSVGVACSTLLTDSLQPELALQLLDSFISRGPAVLEEVILEDRDASVDVWTDVVSLCSGLNRSDLSQAVLSVLLGQNQNRVVSPDLEGARLMEHVYM
ncbi:clathrin heavy chain linker domain-containing protein 1-like [Sphaeramia orbicularis]|uniref:clathrin heavy chain linker domain-containing protein 1-like n=1 Tax=Sphaeramia orbicularis TaxID=375764 RepID=UPI00117D328E|nr:clathrin heavy chain linker domain-containing protein 1 [Sphaeramia orbicularis]XP_030011518.1 clathrin heavy chain linker domain-containing protein 1 [Sphaeramia orbicularis]